MKNLKRLFVSTLTAALFSSVSAYAELPKQSLRAGGIAVIPLAHDVNQVHYNNQPVLIAQPNQAKYAVFGIPLSAPLGRLDLQTNAAPIHIEIQSFQYPEQRLNVKNQNYVNPSQAQLERYAVEAKIQNDI